MSSYTMTAVTTVVVAVAGAELSRYNNLRYNEAHPKLPEYNPKGKGPMKRNVTTVMHPVIAGFTLGLFLFAFGMANERLATLLCLLIVVGSLINNGSHLFQVLSPK